MKKANGEFEEAVTTGLDEIKAELRRANLRIDVTVEHLSLQSERHNVLNERQILLSEQLAATNRQLAATNRQLAATDRQLAATDRQLAATDKKVDRVIAGLSTLLDKVEKLH